MRAKLVAWTMLTILMLPIAAKAQGRFPQLGNAEALKRILAQEPKLPAWARMLATPLPQTTAAMLRLDFVHRAQNPLDPILRAKIRWSAADAIGCDYSKRVAAFDLRSSGLARPAAQQFLETGEAYSPKEEAALKMARKLTTAGHSVTDKDMAALMKHYGAKTVVAIVHTVAHANFQDRIFLALGVKNEKDGPYPPLNLQTKRSRKRTRPDRQPWKEVQAGNKEKAKFEPGWKERSFDKLKKALADQRKRKSRIELPKSNRSRVNWNTVGMVYQPKLTRAWFNCMNTYFRESDVNRVFANSMFWVVTRSNECFY